MIIFTGDNCGVSARSSGDAPRHTIIINTPAKPPSPKPTSTPAANGGEVNNAFEGESFNHRSIEVVPPIPIKTLGRAATMEQKPEVNAEMVNHTSLKVSFDNGQFNE